MLYCRMFVEWFSRKMVGPFFISSFGSSAVRAQGIAQIPRTDTLPAMASYFFKSNARDDKKTVHPTQALVRLQPEAPHTPPEAGGFHSEPSSMRLAQLPTACPARDALLQGSRPRIRAAARQLNGTRIRCGTPPPPQCMGGTTGHGRNTHLRQMRTASHSCRPMGPRPHRQQTKLDRARTSQLQQERRTAQSNRKRRTLDTTLSQATAAATVAANRQARTQTRHDTNESNASGRTKQAHTTKTTKHTPKQEKIQSTNPPTPLGG